MQSVGGTLRFIEILGFSVCLEPAGVIVSRALDSGCGAIVNTFNPHSYVVQKSDQEFSAALKESTALLPDGSGIVLAGRLLGVSVRKVAGYDFFIEALRQCDERELRVLLIGSTDYVLERMRNRIGNEFPNIELRSVSPPFRQEFSHRDVADALARANCESVDVVFVGMTAPKQEKFIRLLSEHLTCRLMSGVGAVFDFYAGTVQRPSGLWLTLHLEWLVRLLGEPRRLWRRTVISGPVFLWDFTLGRIRGESGSRVGGGK